MSPEQRGLVRELHEAFDTAWQTGLVTLYSARLSDEQISTHRRPHYLDIAVTPGGFPTIKTYYFRKESHGEPNNEPLVSGSRSMIIYKTKVPTITIYEDGKPIVRQATSEDIKTTLKHLENFSRFRTAYQQNPLSK